jgi:hypothetical protein
VAKAMALAWHSTKGKSRTPSANQQVRQMTANSHAFQENVGTLDPSVKPFVNISN